MNKYEEALEKYGNHYWAWGNDERFQADLKTLQELVALHTPTRVIGLSISHDGYVANCPHCKGFIRQKDNRFFHDAQNCGGALDWSKEEQR